MKVAVVTASVGANELIEPIDFGSNIDYHAFVDSSKINSNNSWIKHKVLEFSSDPLYSNRRNAKIYKILPFLFLSNYDYYFWVDSTHILNKHPKYLIEKYLNQSDVAVFKHNRRNCVYDESDAIKKANFDHFNLIDDQIQFYKDMNYPKNNGLYELPCRIQRNTEKIQQMSLMWWEQICMFSSRDQLSFPFVCHRFNIIPEIMPGFANGFNQNEIMPQIVYSNHRRTNNV